MTRRVFAIDPGTTQSGWTKLEAGRVIGAGVYPNDVVLDAVRVLGGYIAAGLVSPWTLAIECFEARGMPIGNDSIETVLWTGRFMQAWHAPQEVVRVKRSDVKLALCGTSRAKDPNVRQALIDRLGPVGTKRAPGPCYGVSSHAWAALGVAVVAA